MSDNKTKPVAWMNPDGGFMSEAKRNLHLSRGDDKGLAAWHNTPLFAGEPESESDKPKIRSWTEAASND